MLSHRDKLWKQLATELGGEYINRPGEAFDRVVSRRGPWTIVLDAHFTPGYKTEHPHTRLRAAYFSPHNFKFQLHSTGLFGSPPCPSGMKPVKLGDPSFDRKYTAYATNPDKLRKLLENPRLRQTLANQHDLHLRVLESDPSLTMDAFPADVDELHYETHGEVRNPVTLRDVYGVFVATLEALHEMGEATGDAPPQQL